MMTNLEPGSLEHLLHLALVHVVRQVGDVSSERWSSWDPAGKLLKQIDKRTFFLLQRELEFTKLLLVIIDVRAKCGGGGGRKYNLKDVEVRLLCFTIC